MKTAWKEALAIKVAITWKERGQYLKSHGLVTLIKNKKKQEASLLEMYVTSFKGK